jgi:site-specific DNA-methyltransferase (adenine-specific)
MSHATNKAALFTSKSDIFLTPPHILDAVCQVGPIDFDPCPHPVAEATRRARRHNPYPIVDGLKTPWARYQRDQGVTFVNPPYGRVLSQWADKMAAETQNAIICLVPARVETRWWHTLAKHTVAWCAIGGRLKFYDEYGVETPHSAPFPSAVCLLHRPELLFQFQRSFEPLGIVYAQPGLRVQ